MADLANALPVGVTQALPNPLQVPVAQAAAAAPAAPAANEAQPKLQVATFAADQNQVVPIAGAAGVPAALDLNQVKLDLPGLKMLDRLSEHFLADGQFTPQEIATYQNVRRALLQRQAPAQPPVAGQPQAPAQPPVAGQPQAPAQPPVAGQPQTPAQPPVAEQTQAPAQPPVAGQPRTPAPKAKPKPKNKRRPELNKRSLQFLDRLRQHFLKDGQFSKQELNVYKNIRQALIRNGVRNNKAATEAPEVGAQPGTKPTGGAAGTANPIGGAASTSPEAKTFNPSPSWSEMVKTLESKLGPTRWMKDKRQKLLSNDSPAYSSKAWGPKTTKFMRSAYDALQSGDISKAEEMYRRGASTASPVMLDLNGDGKLGTTGVSTAKNRVDNAVGKTVSFDIDGDGAKDQVEWMDGKGDGMLVDDRDGGATAAAAGNGQIDGKRLFGDEGGKFNNGYEKMAKLDANGDGKLTGAELEGLKVWVDNGDASVGQGELKSLKALGVTEISVKMQTTQNARGEDLMQSSFTQNGQQKLTEDVWFAKK
jgi:hypothetical protein